MSSVEANEQKNMDSAETKTNFSIGKAHLAQLRLSRKIIHEDVLPEKIRLIAGVDAAYLKDFSIGAVAVLDYSSLEVLESQTAICRTFFPYVPTLLSFREIPPTFRSIQKLRSKPDVFLVDAHGFAHPYRCGLASHLGVMIGKPTIGVAKGWLFGNQEAGSRNNIAFLKVENEVIGAVIESRSGEKPVYVSVGHMVSLETAIKIVKHCTRRTRIPEPILKAHQISTSEREKMKSSTINRSGMR